MGATESKSCGEACSVRQLSERSQHIEKLVGESFTKQIDPLEMEHKIKIVSTKKEDLSKPLKAVATDFVVAEYFATTDTLYQFLALVHDVFDEALILYREQRNLTEHECFFMFKGGNILRVVAHEFLDELPEHANAEIRKFYEPFFKRSDNDFSILLNPDLDDYDAIFSEVTTLAYHLQNYIRSIFMTDLTRYFDFARYRPEFRQKIYSRWLPKFNAARQEGESEFIDISGASGRDRAMRYVNQDYGRDERKVASSDINREEQQLVITHNDALEFPDANGGKIAFNLTRTKVVFTLRQKDGGEFPVKGELIDVSVPHKTDGVIGHFFEELEENIATYKLDMTILGQQPLHFISGSLSYLMSDLENMLYIQSKYPWGDAKYGKRMNRLIYMYFIDIFIKVKTGPARVTILEDVKAFLDGDDKVRLPRDLAIHKLVVQIRKIRRELSQSDDFDEMVALILKNLDFLSETLQKVHDYCSTDGMVTAEEIYNGKSGSLI
uniref:Uncharacterized protein n=1 Tax=viral metagenome TaxID=1070528 RepID=A0A6C0CGA5_9ZZZZ